MLFLKSRAAKEENIAKRSDPTWSKIPHVLTLVEPLEALGLQLPPSEDVVGACWSPREGYLFNCGESWKPFDGGHNNYIIIPGPRKRCPFISQKNQ